MHKRNNYYITVTHEEGGFFCLFAFLFQGKLFEPNMLENYTEKQLFFPEEMELKLRIN